MYLLMHFFVIHIYSFRYSLRESIQVSLSRLKRFCIEHRKFYNGNDAVNVMAAELRLTKTRLTSIYKKNNLL